MEIRIERQAWPAQGHQYTGTGRAVSTSLGELYFAIRRDPASGAVRVFRLLPDVAGSGLYWPSYRYNCPDTRWAVSYELQQDVVRTVYGDEHGRQHVPGLLLEGARDADVAVARAIVAAWESGADGDVR